MIDAVTKLLNLYNAEERSILVLLGNRIVTLFQFYPKLKRKATFKVAL